MLSAQGAIGQQRRSLGVNVMHRPFEERISLGLCMGLIAKRPLWGTILQERVSWAFLQRPLRAGKRTRGRF